MNAGNFVPAVEDTWFLLSQVEDTSGLLALPAFAHTDAETARAALDAASDFTRELVVPLGPAGDAEGCRLEDGRVRTPRGFPEAYRAWSAAGWPGFDLPLEAGGQSLPLCVQVALAEMVNGASVAFGMLALQQRSAAHLLIGHADPALRERILPRLLAGDWVATICITEPEAGSDVGRIRTLAVPQDDGSYALSGSKMFITFGDSDCAERTVHLALARTPGAPAGTPGISLFALPSRRFADDAPNGITVLRIEHKMGLRASPTCALALEHAIGHRIGAEGQGLKCLFTMMNLMRLEVAVQGVALAEAATQRALAYAA
ncbi:MAG: acyl-CoA dehydrogenase family protein, partial [Gammaproteobacteria bacterium]